MKGKIKVKSINDNYMELEFKDVPYYYVNAIRRYSIGLVPVYAIDKVIIYENKTSFFDEYIAHRIGMIPIKVEADLKAEDIGFYLDEQGPKKVYSSSLKSNKKEAKVALDNIPLITLREGQSIRLEGRVKKGVGREHSKFQSGISSYEIKEDKKGYVTGNMFIETLYHFTPQELFYNAVDQIIKDIEDFSSSLSTQLKE